MIPPSKGYIVLGEKGVKALAPDGILYYIGRNRATVFSTRNLARRAINRSKYYAKKRGFDHDAWKVFEIARLE